MGYSPWSCRGLEKTEQLSMRACARAHAHAHTHTHTHTHTQLETSQPVAVVPGKCTLQKKVKAWL